MPIDDYEWRPITFQGVTFPATLMGISIFVSFLDITEDDPGDWLWSLSNCRGCSKRVPAERCARCARQLADLLLEQRQQVLESIRKNLGPHGFEPEETYRDWLLALQKIAELSAIADDDCVWSSPSRPGDATAADAKRFLDWLDNQRGKTD